MSAIDDFRKANADLHHAIAWRSLIGSQYAGGGGGFGNVVGSECKFTIYHQPYNGATNYHDCPCVEFQTCLNNAAKEMAVSIIDRAILLMRERVAKAAAAAEAERLQIAAAMQEESTHA